MPDNDNNTAGAGNETGKTFTQAELNAIVEARLARERDKYADYDSLKEKAGKYDEAEESKKTELQKATDKMSALQKELDALKSANTVKAIREKVAKDTEVPVELLTADTEEACKAQADAILKFARPKSYPGTHSSTSKPKTNISTQDAAMRELAHSIFNRGE
jgi:uncharacterized protein YhaN